MWFNQDFKTSQRSLVMLNKLYDVQELLFKAISHRTDIRDKNVHDGSAICMVYINRSDVG